MYIYIYSHIYISIINTLYVYIKMYIHNVCIYIYNVYIYNVYIYNVYIYNVYIYNVYIYNVYK